MDSKGACIQNRHLLGIHRTARICSKAYDVQKVLLLDSGRDTDLRNCRHRSCRNGFWRLGFGGTVSDKFTDRYVRTVLYRSMEA